MFAGRLLDRVNSNTLLDFAQAHFSFCRESEGEVIVGQFRLRLAHPGRRVAMSRSLQVRQQSDISA